MTTFDIDNTKKTKYLVVLDSLEGQAKVLPAIHNPQTWRLSALTFALHIHDCIVLFGALKEKWKTRLPFSEAWDVDFTKWKSKIWRLVNDIPTFDEETEYVEWQRLCEEDYHTFIEKAQKYLSGELPLKELNEFLSEKNTELKQIIVDSGKDLSSLFSETEDMLYKSDAALYEKFYDDLVNISMNENGNEYWIDDNGTPMPYAKWKASRSQKRLPDLIEKKVEATRDSMLAIKFWKETWDECFDFDNKTIDKEGFARYVFQNRKKIIENNQYPCKNCLGRCFAALCLCEHLWQEYNLLMNTGGIASTHKEKVQGKVAMEGSEDEGIVEKLLPVFKQDKEEARKFLAFARNHKGTMVTERVTQLSAEKKTDNKYAKNTMHEILNQHGIYTYSLSNWNKQVKLKWD